MNLEYNGYIWELLHFLGEIMILWLSRKLSWIKRCLLKHLWSQDSYSHMLSQKNCYCCCLVGKLEVCLCDSIDCRPPGSSVYGISQAKILEWVAISFSRGTSQSRDWIHISCTGSLPLSHLRSPSQKNKCTYMARRRMQFWQNINNWWSVSFLGSKINVDSDCSHEIGKTLAPEE